MTNFNFTNVLDTTMAYLSWLQVAGAIIGIIAALMIIKYICSILKIVVKPIIVFLRDVFGLPAIKLLAGLIMLGAGVGGCTDRVNRYDPFEVTREPHHFSKWSTEAQQEFHDKEALKLQEALLISKTQPPMSAPIIGSLIVAGLGIVIVNMFILLHGSFDDD